MYEENGNRKRSTKGNTREEGNVTGLRKREE
jgi:hypothetical protein